PLFITHPPDHTPKHTLWVSGCATTAPWFITPLESPCELRFYHPGNGRYQKKPQDTTPGENMFKPKTVVTGVCYLGSFAVSHASLTSHTAAFVLLFSPPS
ncbi:unnamed protein product, partial [Ectocarpus sp. 12 AP-2014]